MVLQWRQRHDRAAVGDRHHAHLHAVELFLDEDALGGGRKLRIATERRDGLERRGAVAADEDSLAGGQAVGLHHHRDVLAGLEKLAGGRHRTKLLKHGGRHVAAVQDLLAENLAALELRRLGGGAEHPQSGGREGIDDAGDERRLRPDDREIDAALLGELHEAGDVGRRHRHVLGDRRRARVAGSHEHLRAVAGQLPGEGMFAAAAAYDQNTAGCGHGRILPEKEGGGAREQRRRRIVAVSLPPGQGGTVLRGVGRDADVDTSAAVDTVKWSS